IYFWCSPLPWCDGRCVQGPGTYSPRHSDPRLLAIPTSWSRVADSNPDYDVLYEIRIPSQASFPLYNPLYHVCSPSRKGHDDLTSSPPSSGLSPAVSPEFPTESLATKDKGCARCGTYANISQHELTTAMQHLSHRSRRHSPISKTFCGCQGMVRFFALHRIKPHAPPLVRAPVNSFEF